MNKYVATTKNALPVTRVLAVSQLAPNPQLLRRNSMQSKKRDPRLHDVHIFKCGFCTPPLIRRRKREVTAATVMAGLRARGPADALSAD